MFFATKKVLQSKPKKSFKEDADVDVRSVVPPRPKANTNVISIDLGKLAQECELLTGDPIFCEGCEAIYNSTSKHTQLEKVGEYLWQCEFCDHVNTIHPEKEEIPTKDTCDYMLEPPKDKTKEISSNTIVFCIDISGSMCVSTELIGKKLKLIGDRTNELASLNNEGLNQFLPGQRKDVTYVSRLQCVQAAIESQLQTLQKEYPNAKVGLVCFNGEVTIIGDGTKDPVIVTGDKLNDYNTLLSIGRDYKIETPISISKNALTDKLIKLVEAGPTALGPAMTIAVGMATNSPGSKIVLATDGLANKGVGSLDDPSLVQVNSGLYTILADLSKTLGTTISVIGIKGDSINMGRLGVLADNTGGDVDIVDPVHITEHFASILESKLVASDVVVKLFLHKGFTFPTGGDWINNVINTGEKAKRQLYAVRKIGNAFEDTEITAEFTEAPPEILAGIFNSEKEEQRSEKEQAEKEVKEEKIPLPPVPMERVQKEKVELPFQLQITYSALSGMKCTRVITKTKEVSDDFREVEKEVDVTVLGMHANFLSAQKAQQGDFEGAINITKQIAPILEANLVDDLDSVGFAGWHNETATFNMEVEKQKQSSKSDDTYSNMQYQRKNAKHNKKQWSDRRKY